LDDRPENLLVYDDKVYVALEGGTSVAVIDPATLAIDEITVPAGPSNMVVDDLGMIWVLCTSGSLIEIDPSTASTGVSIDGLTTAGYREKLSIDGTGNYLYFLAGGNDSFTGLTKVYKVDLRSQQVDPIIEDGVALYGLGINPESGHIYLGDSNAFQSTGTAFIYNSSGSKLDEFSTGIGPKGFLFMRN
jgi:DNA-binding beta-propeller fold protein YncE